ncbi:hypothetical protein SISNIDRAFT_483078 [Sistotremastrum niveocremeum HHB9708]|uniref:DUF6532 domain-containing protein n=1 Tax=Sistotremastrum niveocremeum HHB9708 TaxID=1314777 RepID=A0A164Y2M1_9AGAM|nr:hypothetical protein SISNIDRAFT_483078 [Sistotremastrum niveocremeum HHB9708]
MAPSKKQASESPPKKASSSSNASKNKQKAAAAAAAAQAKNAALSGGKRRAGDPPKDGGSTGSRRRVNADKENMPFNQHLEPTRKSGRLAGVPARTEKGELLDNTTAKRNTRTAVKISRQGSDANRKKLAETVADDDVSSDIEMQVPKSKGKGRNTIASEGEDEEPDSGVRGVYESTFKSVPHTKKSGQKDTHKIPSTFASLESSQGGIQRNTTQASSASQKSGNLEEAVLGSARNSEPTPNPNPRAPVIGESTSDPIFSSTPPRPTDHRRSSSTREEDNHRKSTPRSFGEVPSQNYRHSDGASTTNRTGSPASKPLSTPITKGAQGTANYGRPQTRERSLAPAITPRRNQNQSVSPRRSQHQDRDRYRETQAQSEARQRRSHSVASYRFSAGSQAGDDRPRGRAKSRRPLFLDGATEELAASEGEDDEPEDMEDSNGEDVADESERESVLMEDDVDGVGEWDNEDDETIGEGTRTTRRASECMPYPTNIKPYYIQAETGLKVPRRNPRYTTGKVNRGHYHTQFHGQFGKAWKFFGFKLLSECLYPDPDMARRFAMDSWCEAGERCYPPTNYGYDDNILKNIEQRGSQLRGELKTAAKAQLGHYGIIKSRSKKIMRKNRALMKPLIELGQFTFEDHTDPDNAIMYGNPALAAILRQAVFKKGKLGEYFQEEFELDIRFELIAAAATAMEHVLDEYVNGFFTKVKWSSERYLGVWESHVRALEDLAGKGSDPVQSCTKLCKRIMKDVL